MALAPLLRATLNRYNLGGLIDWATQTMIGGMSQEEFLLQLYDRPEFIARFPGIKAREQAGYPPINPEEYLAYEDMMYGMSRMWGLDINKGEIDQLISGNISMREAEERVNLAAAAVFDEPQETIGELQRMYDVGTGQLIRYWMDPKRTQGVLQQQFRTAQIAGSALRSGYGQVTEQQAKRLLQAGMDGASALTGFSQLVQTEELFKSIVGTEDEVDQDTQIELLAGNAQVAQDMETRAKRRLADYQGGGGFAAGQTGFGVGSSSS